MLTEARSAFDSDLTLGMDADDTGIIAPLLAAFNLGNYACEAAEHLIAPADHDQDIAMEDIFDLSDDIDNLPFGRLIPFNEFRRVELGQIPGKNHFLFPWLTEGLNFDYDSLERIIQVWDELWDGTASKEDTEALVPVLTTIQSDTVHMAHLKAEAGFHASVMKAAGELNRQQHMERARRSAEEGFGIMDRIISWFRMPAVSGAVALILMVGIYFSTQLGKDDQPMSIGVTMEMLVYQDGLTVRGGEGAKPEIRKPGDTPPEEGDAFQIRFTLEEPAYIYLYHLEPNAKSELLYSNRLNTGLHSFPSEEKRMRIVERKVGESIVLIASSIELDKTSQLEAINETPTDEAALTVIHIQL